MMCKENLDSICEGVVYIFLVKVFSSPRLIAYYRAPDVNMLVEQ